VIAPIEVVWRARFKSGRVIAFIWSTKQRRRKQNGLSKETTPSSASNRSETAADITPRVVREAARHTSMIDTPIESLSSLLVLSQVERNDLLYVL